MNEKLSTLFNKIKADSDLLTVSEAQTSQGIVLPILHNLGWDVFDTNEVVPEFTVGNRRVDYALRIQSLNKVFLEIKKTSEDLEKHQEQLVYYAFQQGVKLAILTNGVTWWFYLPLEEGGWEHRKFFTIDLMEQSVEDAVEKFENLLDKSRIENGTAYKNAKSLYDGKQKSKIVKENLPKAWEKLISEPDEMLVELLNDTLEKISGYKAEDNQIIRFLQQIFPNADIPTNSISKPKSTKTRNSLNTKVQSATSKNLIQLNPEKLESLLHTKILEAKFANIPTPNNWRSVLDTGLKTAFDNGISSETITDNVNINLKKGNHRGHGYYPVEGTGYSFQNQDATKSAENALRIARLLNCEFYVLFMWREKGKFPMQEGIIHWKP